MVVLITKGTKERSPHQVLSFEKKIPFAQNELRGEKVPYFTARIQLLIQLSI